MTIAPHEIEAFQHLSLFVKGIRIVTGHLSKMMTSNYSLSHSTSCRRRKKPTAWSEAWKKDRSQGEICSYDNLSLHPTANIQSRSPRTTKEFNLKSLQLTGSQLSDEDQKTITTMKKNQHKSNFKDYLATNKAYRIKDKPFILNPDGKRIYTNTIKTKSNPSTQKRTTMGDNNRPLSSNQPDTNSYKICNKEEQKVQLNTSRTSSSINKIEFETIDATDTENKEEVILNKIVNYIERKIKNQPISTKEKVSTKLKNITTYIDNKEDIYYLLNSDNHISRLNTSITTILREEKCSEGILNQDEKVILRYFIFTNDRNNFYHTDKSIQELITKI
ncbi:hypothetical protein O181_037158 [Austropuccinia psidii MF-1]|uniref:Uncharacterized protein n=1 Tax=Austropuccinia psidii MF-1 TaxID=1389203 RepID=A0A9Q3DAV3_9BASI|nr:hypothetical protein [Austropuccinia psidii MF-1]